MMMRAMFALALLVTVCAADPAPAQLFPRRYGFRSGVHIDLPGFHYHRSHSNIVGGPSIVSPPLLTPPALAPPLVIPGQSYYAAPSPYGIYYNPASNYVDYYLPPLQFPAELLYGPQAMKQFMGVDRNFALGPLLGGLAPDVDAAPLAEGVDPAPEVRVSNADTRRRARDLRDIGDNLFRRGKYHEALQQYKSAARIAPDLAELYFRQAHALIATARYDLAAEAAKRGMAIDASWVAAPFRLDSIYEIPGDKSAHIEALSKAVLDAEHDGDLWFLLGVCLHFDGQAERAAKFLERAAELTPKDAAHIAPFLAERAAKPGLET